MFTSFDKALVAPIVAVVMAVLSHFGVTELTTVTDIVTLFVTGGLVWLVPNKKI